MIAKPRKKELSLAQRVAITQAGAKQTGSTSSPKTYDPNYPLFEIPVNKKVLVYIPKHPNAFYTDEQGNQLKDAEGNPIPRNYVDKFAAHSVRNGKQYLTVRCSGEVSDVELELDGSCPICDASQKCWDLYNIQYASLCKSMGLEPDSVEAQEQLKDKRKDLLSKRVIQQPDIYRTFPIVVVETEEGSLKIKPQADGTVKGIPMFYTIRETTYAEKWWKPYEALIESGQAEEDSEPFGWWAILNFTYDAKGGEPNKRDSAKALQVSFSHREGMTEIENYFDNLTVEWDAIKAQDVLVANAVRDMSEMKATADEIIKPVVEQLRMHELSEGAGAPAIGTTVGNAEATLADFGATESTPTDAGATPPTIPTMTSASNVE